MHTPPFHHDCCPPGNCKPRFSNSGHPTSPSHTKKHFPSQIVHSMLPQTLATEILARGDYKSCRKEGLRRLPRPTPICILHLKSFRFQQRGPKPRTMISRKMISRNMLNSLAKMSDTSLKYIGMNIPDSVSGRSCQTLAVRFRK